MKCTHCGKPVILVPSAKERAKKYGGSANYYTKLFPMHNKCILAKRKEGMQQLLAKRKEGMQHASDLHRQT